MICLYDEISGLPAARDIARTDTPAAHDQDLSLHRRPCCSATRRRGRLLCIRAGFRCGRALCPVLIRSRHVGWRMVVMRGVIKTKRDMTIDVESCRKL
jgi:hypothetical protein